MINRSGPILFRSLMWKRVFVMSFMLFFVYLGDAILSDWIPFYMQTALGGSLFMGLVMSFSSLVGFSSDLVLPQLIKKVKTKKMIQLAIGASLIFSGILLITTAFSWLVLFLLAMAVWGVYYELLKFGLAQFVSGSISVKNRIGVWAVINVFRSLAYFSGPIIGSWLALNRGNVVVVVAAAALVCVGYIIWLLSREKEKNHIIEIESDEQFDIREEIGHWRVLFVHVWQVLLISFLVGIIDATYWTTGTVLSDNLARSNIIGGLFLPLYMLPPIFMGIVLAKRGVYRGKKKIAEVFLLISGLLLSCLGFNESVYVMLVLSFMVGVSLSVTWPMVDAIYSDILSRMGRERKHMMGLSSSMTSLAYIFGPVSVGYISSVVGERMTFVVVGVVVSIIATVLLFVTPRKLRLPQLEIATWKD